MSPIKLFWSPQSQYWTVAWFGNSPHLCNQGHVFKPDPTPVPDILVRNWKFRCRHSEAKTAVTVPQSQRWWRTNGQPHNQELGDRKALPPQVWEGGGPADTHFRLLDSRPWHRLLASRPWDNKFHLMKMFTLCSWSCMTWRQSQILGPSCFSMISSLNCSHKIHQQPDLWFIP